MLHEAQQHRQSSNLAHYAEPLLPLLKASDTLDVIVNAATWSWSGLGEMAKPKRSRACAEEATGAFFAISIGPDDNDRVSVLVRSDVLNRCP